MFRGLIQKITYVHNSIKARLARHWVQREVLNVLTPFHAQELAAAGPLSWPMLKAKHAAEVAAVREGKLHMSAVVDRRSWQYPYVPESLHRLNAPILKNTPYNLRRFSETPIPRRAINLIKNTILSLPWKLDVVEGFELNKERQKRIKIGTRNFNHPNNSDSFRTFLEQVLEDFVIGGYGSIEPRLTPDYERPFKLWAVDGSTIRIFADWTEGEPDKPRYAQMTGLKGERGIITFLDDEFIYIRDNVRSNTPFGLGKLETCFNTVNAFLGAQDAASKAGSDQIHKTWMWWEESLNRGQMETVGRHLRNEAEGQSKVSLISGLPKPEVLDMQAVTEEDLLLNWQEFLIRVIATGFDLSAMALGVERDVNRSTAEVLDAKDFNSAAKPAAVKIQEAFTRYVLHRLLGWKDIQFQFIGLDHPDMQARINMSEQLYKLDVLNSDDIAKDLGRTPDASGWGRLSMSQKAIVALMAQSMLASKQAQQQQAMMPPAMPGAVPGAPGKPAGLGPAKVKTVPGMDKGLTKETPLRPPALPGVARQMRGSVFTPYDVAAMNTQQITILQMAGLLPKDKNELKKNMEDSEPGILDQLTDELKEYFEHIEKESVTIEPEKVTSQDEKEQKKRFAKIEGPKGKRDLGDRAKSVTGKPLKQRTQEKSFNRRYM